jgi:FkbH-like protein
MTSLRIAVLGASNVDLLPRYLERSFAERGLDAKSQAGPFGRYRQEILDHRSELYAFSPTHVVLALDFEDLFRDVARGPLELDAEARAARVETEAAELERLVDHVQERLPDAFVLLQTVIAPPRSGLRTLEHNSPYSIRDVAWAFNARLRRIGGARSRRAIVDVEALVAWHGYRDSYDDRMWCLGRIRWGHDAMARLAGEYARVVRATVATPRKCVVLDLDGTLWGGIVGEDGADVIVGHDGLGLAYREFQEELLELHRRGTLLAIASKNTYEDAFAILSEHPGMALRPEHFSAMRINWVDKVENIRSIADELELGLESFVFVDDDPVVRAWVASQLPEVAVLQLPADPALYRRALLEFEGFDALAVTTDDRRRPQLYRQRALAEELRRRTPTLEEFYADLDMRATIAPPTSHTLSRIGQLTRKTNQFNLTTRRYRDDEISDMTRDPRARVYGLSLEDRFGDNGLVGVGILRKREDDWWIDTLLLSCRVMGRTVETALLSFLAARVAELGGSSVFGEFVPTAKNGPSRDFYPSHGFERVDREGRVWRLDLAGGPPPAPAHVKVRGETGVGAAA